MLFKVIAFNQYIPSTPNSAYLIWDSWNDYSYQTLYHLRYVDHDGLSHKIGDVKIAYLGQGKGGHSLEMDETFSTLLDNYFSLGQDDFYYENLNKLGSTIREEILMSLNDIALNLNLFERVYLENVTQDSLLRWVTKSSVEGQLHRIALGGVRLTSFNFLFSTIKKKGRSNSITLSFDVEPESIPPTNIHVIIGRNGVGKTHLINSMINSLVFQDSEIEYGNFNTTDSSSEMLLFSNLISVSFSAFDDWSPKSAQDSSDMYIPYSYIGLKRIGKKASIPKSPVILKNEFVQCIGEIIRSSKVERWKRALLTLESDPNFKEFQVSQLTEIKNEIELEIEAAKLFKKLSSGHKIILLTISKLIEKVEEKSLVLIDEPEAHLHPPLLSAFTRALSDLLIDRNGVAIIATHSPVILQEVPKSCVWKIRSIGAEKIAERPENETFGENVGLLTREVFGLEVTSSGFYKILNSVVNEVGNYKAVLQYFDGQLGMEARSIVMALLNDRNKK